MLSILICSHLNMARLHRFNCYVCRKLIGVRYFNKGYAADLGTPLNESLNSARDLDGHGSHTLSTAGGNFVPHTSILNISNGTASGGSPRARVAAYKVCWPVPDTDGVCYDADIMAAVDAAISDGVDVLSMSIGRTGGVRLNLFNHLIGFIPCQICL